MERTEAPWSQGAGSIAGRLLAPVTGKVSALRRARMFHPSGLLCRAHVVTAPAERRLEPLATALAGPALVRFSSALWKQGEAPDVLGCALRFTREPLGVVAHEGDQDLLLATIQRPWTMPFAPFTTRRHDFFANTYFGVSPFEVEGLGRVEWRLVPEPAARASAARGGPDRRGRIARALREGTAVLGLELAPYAGPLKRPRPASFRRVVQLCLTSWLDDLDQEALRFDPFRTGRGIRPVGFVHDLRRATYARSQAERPPSTAPR